MKSYSLKKDKPWVVLSKPNLTKEEFESYKSKDIDPILKKQIEDKIKSESEVVLTDQIVIDKLNSIYGLLKPEGDRYIIIGLSITHIEEDLYSGVFVCSVDKKRLYTKFDYKDGELITKENISS
jgi:hypothetical protein